MNYEVVTIFDTKAKVYSRPLFFPTLALIDRYAQDVLSNPNNDVSRHPSDFSLFHLGSYSDSTAQFDFLSVPTCLLRFHEVVLVKPQEASNA